MSTKKSKNLKNQTKKLNICPIAFAIAIALNGSLVTTAKAATYTVTNNNDSGANSLRQLIVTANGNAGADIIEFAIPSGSIINLNSKLEITDSLTILLMLRLKI